jgi:hypothetical protein
MCAPPPIDMWEPRRMFDVRCLIFDCGKEGESDLFCVFFVDPIFLDFGLRSPIVPDRKIQIRRI